MATKTLGFRLEVRGNDKTLSELDKVYKSLAAIRGQIKEVNSKQVKLNTAVDTKGLNDLLKLLDKAKTAKISPEATKEVTKLKSELVALKKELKLAQDTLDKLKVPELSATQVKEVNTHLIKTEFLAKQIIEGAERTRQAFNNIDDKSIRELDTSLAKLEIKLKGLRDAKIRVKADKTLSDNEKATVLQPLIEEEKKLVEQQKLLNREIAVTTKEFANQKQNIPKDSLIGLRTELSKLTLEYDKLTAAELEASKGTEIKNKINLVTNEINSREQAVQNFRRNVGNYQSAITGLLPELNKLSQAGIIAQKDMLAIFRSDLVAKEQALEKEVKDLGLAFKELGNDISKAAQRAEIIGKLDDKVRELTSVRGNIDQLSNDFGSLSGKLLSVSDIVTGGLIGGGIIESIGALKSFASGSISEFTQAETAISKINQQLLVTGNASGQSAAGLVQMSKELEVLTGIDGDQILNDVTSALLKFGNIQGEVFERTQKAAIDLSATLAGDLAGAAAILGKAIEDPEKAAGRLAKAGILLSKETKQAIDNAIKANDTYKAQTILLDALEGKFKGVSSAIQNSKLKEVRQFTVDFNNFKEAIGGALIGAFSGIVYGFRNLASGATFAKIGTKETVAAVRELNLALTKEKDTIQSGFAVLKNENIARNERNDVIDQLVAKYPDLLDKQELEHASMGRLIEIEDQLTETVKKNIFQRVLARAEESAAAAEDAERIRLAQLRTRDFDNLGFGDRFSLVFKKQFGSADTFDEAFKQAEEESKRRLEAYKVQTKKIKEELKKSLEEEFGAINEAKIIQKKIIKGAGSIAIDPEAEGKANDKLKEQLQLLEQLKSKLQQFNIDNISDSFEKKKEEAKRKAANDAKEFETLIKQIGELKIPLNVEQQGSIESAKLAIKSIADNLITELQVIDREGAQARQEALSELKADRDAVLKILSDIESSTIEIELDQAKFDFDQSKRVIELEFKSNVSNLTEELNKGLITEEQFNTKSEELEKTKLDKIAKLYNGFLEEYKAKLQIRYNYEVEAANKLLEVERANAQNVLRLKNQQVQNDIIDDNLDVVTGFDLKVKNLISYYAAIQKVNSDHNDKLFKAKQKFVNDSQKIDDESNDAIFNFQAAIFKFIKKKNDEAKESGEALAEKRKQLLEQVRETAISIANEVSDTIFEIENSQAEALFEKRKSLIEREAETRILLAKGNANEIHKIELERDAKLKALEKEQQKRQQKAAIAQAIINGALAVTSIFAQPGILYPLKIIQAIQVAISTALQVAKIRSQKFAKGGFAGGYTGGSRAPIDETGERPVDADLHEGEFVSTRKQVTKHRLIYDLLEKDRIKTNSGQASTIMADLENMVIKRRESIFAQRPTRARYEPIIPVIVPAASRQKIEIKLSDDQIKIFANEVARQVKEASLEGTTKGTIEGSIKAAKETFNFKLTKERSTV